MKNTEKIDDELPLALKEWRARGDGMNLPEGYFEQMERAVFARLETSGSPKYPRRLGAKRSNWVALFVRPKAALAYAAALSLVLAAVWFVRQNYAPTPISLSVAASLTEADIENYLLDNLHEFELGHLAMLSSEIDTEALPPTPKENVKNSSWPADEIHPDDLDKVLNDMTEEELEQIL